MVRILSSDELQRFVELAAVDARIIQAFQLGRGQGLSQENLSRMDSMLVLIRQ